MDNVKILQRRFEDESIKERNKLVEYYNEKGIMRTGREITKEADLRTLLKPLVKLGLCIGDENCNPVLGFATIPIIGRPAQFRQEAQKKAGIPVRVRKSYLLERITACSFQLSNELTFKDKVLYNKSLLPTGYQPLDIAKINDNFSLYWIDLTFDQPKEPGYWQLYYLTQNPEEEAELVPYRRSVAYNSGSLNIDIPLFTTMLRFSCQDLLSKECIETFRGFDDTDFSIFNDVERKEKNILDDVPEVYDYDNSPLMKATEKEGTTKILVQSVKKGQPIKLNGVLPLNANLYTYVDSYFYDPLTGDRISDEDIAKRADVKLMTFANRKVLPAAYTWISQNMDQDGHIKPVLWSYFVQSVHQTNTKINEFVMVNGERKRSGKWVDVEKALILLRSRYFALKDTDELKTMIKAHVFDEGIGHFLADPKTPLLNWTEGKMPDTGEPAILFLSLPITYIICSSWNMKLSINKDWSTMDNLTYNDGRQVKYSYQNSVIVSVLAIRIKNILNNPNLSASIDIDKFLTECGVDLSKDFEVDYDAKDFSLITDEDAEAVKTEMKKIKANIRQKRSRYISVMEAHLNRCVKEGKIAGYNFHHKTVRGQNHIDKLVILPPENCRRTDVEEKRRIAKDKQHRMSESIKKEKVSKNKKISVT